MIKTTLRSVLKLALSVLAAVTAVVLVAALAIQYRIHIANEWQQYVYLPVMSAPQKADRVLVFAPHSDDETLGCAGMIAKAVENGASVHVTLITNGDGFRFAVGRAYKTLRVTPKKCVTFAYRRQKETLGALSSLGVPPERVTFLGYPDRGIVQMWTKYWDRDTLYLSHATKSMHSPYTDSLTRYAPYCGEALMDDVMHVLERDRPTDVYLPHPLDNHPDHYATYCFVAAAIEQLISEHRDFAKKIRLHTYLVHRGDWPVPKGYHPKDPLAPPYAMASGDTRWKSLPLGPQVAKLKRKAIGEYKTQTAVEKSFMMSFARGNEIFGDVPDRKVNRVESWQIAVDGNPDDWRGIPQAVVDPVGDYVMASLSKGGDVRAIYLCSDNDYLYVRIDCAKKLSKQVRYTINVRGISDTDSDDWYTVSIKPPRRCTPKDTHWAYKNNVLEVAVPLSKLRLDEDMFIQVKTMTMKMTVDQTGWHAVEFGAD
ncbi:PIG-L family deacetylase [bacterium]|nr:PIG-L family deacetylase [bacterium]